MITLSFQMKGSPAFVHGFPDDCQILIGRGAMSEGPSATREGDGYRVRLPLPTLSEAHAVVTVSGGVASIMDRRSRNGTLVRLPAGASHLLREWPVSLGSEVLVHLEGAQRGLPDGLGRMSPEALRDLLQSRLAPDAVQVTLGPRLDGALPLTGDPRYLAVLPETDRTVATEDVDWVRAVVSAYNAAVDQRRTEGRWRFVASSALRRMALEQALTAAGSCVPVLLVGPRGSGREVLAQDLHENGRRGGGPFVQVDCASADPEAVERRIFGTAPRSDVIGSGDCPGDLEAADGGTLFLREIDVLSASAQARLARFLVDDAGCFERVGESGTRTARVRVIASTRVDLGNLVAVKCFRDDLYDALQAVVIVVPAPDHADHDAIAAREAPPTPATAGDALATLPVQPAVMGRLLADILFLSVAAGGHPRSELAARLHMTFQGVDARLDTLGVTAGDIPGITRRLQKAEADFRACVLQHGALRALLESLPRG